MTTSISSQTIDSEATKDACILASRMLRGDAGGRITSMRALANLVDYGGADRHLVGLAVGRAPRTLRRWLRVGRMCRKVERNMVTSVTGWEDLALDIFAEQAPHVVEALRSPYFPLLCDGEIPVELEWDDVLDALS